MSDFKINQTEKHAICNFELCKGNLNFGVPDHKKYSRNTLTCILGVLLVILKSRFFSYIASSMEKNQIEKEELDYRQVNIEKNVYDALEKRIKKISQDSELDKPFTVDEIVNSLIKSALIEDTSML